MVKSRERNAMGAKIQSCEQDYQFESMMEEQ